MLRNSNFYRSLFVVISLITTYYYELSLPDSSNIRALVFGTGKSLLFVFLVFLFEAQVKNHKTSINQTVVGILLGSVLGTCLGFAVVHAISLFSSLTHIMIPQDLQNMVTMYVYLGALYLGLFVSCMKGGQWWQQPTQNSGEPIRHKEFLLDISTLEDPRLFDLAKTGLLDNKLLLPSFVLHEIHTKLHSQDEEERIRAKKSQEAIKRLESLSELRMAKRDFPAYKEYSKLYLYQLAEEIQAGIIVSDLDTIEQTAISPSVRIVCLETIANTCKPSAHKGEMISIKIQRSGKEPKQGVGYLDDGTMVVVNGGGDYLQKTIQAQFLSQIYSTSGKIIFCNAIIPEEDSVERTAPHASPYHLPQQVRNQSYASSAIYSKKEPV